MGDEPVAAEAVGKIPSGLFIVVAEADGQIDGFLGSFIQQVSMDPLRISLALKPGRPAYDRIAGGGRFSVNVVGEHETGYLRHFWSGYDPEKNPFAEIAHKTTEEGAIVLEDALAAMECIRCDRFEVGDHELVIADVVACHTLQPEGRPHVHVRKHGLAY